VRKEFKVGDLVKLRNSDNYHSSINKKLWLGVVMKTIVDYQQCVLVDVWWIKWKQVTRELPMDLILLNK